jgi:hypothetical protein
MNLRAVQRSMSVPITPLELPGWLEFNTWRTGLSAHRFTQRIGEEADLDAVLYVDRRGRVRLPPNNPYLAVVFRSERRSASGRTSEWLRAAAPLAAEMRRRGVVNQLYLPPEVEDARPWTWNGFISSVRYTYYLDFPFDDAVVNRETRRQARKAAERGLAAERTDDVGGVLRCLAETEARQGFSHHIGARELNRARELVGEDGLRMYVCRLADGTPAGACVILHAPGARAIGWLAGGSTTEPATGSTQLVWQAAFTDLLAAGAVGIDLGGANIPSVARFKSYWGARLVPNYGIRTHSLRTAARFAADWLASRRRPRHG